MTTLRRVTGSALVVALLLVSLLSTQRAGAQTFEGQAEGQGFVVELADDGSLVVPGAEGGSGDPANVRVVVSSCAEQLADEIDCTVPFDEYCAGRPVDDAANQWRPAVMMSRREAELAMTSAGAWTCLNFSGVAAGPSLEQILARFEAAMPGAEATTNPAISPTTGMIETLVRLPLILHFDESRELSVTEDIEGHRVTIAAHAARFEWTAGEHVVRTSDVGVPYSSDQPCYPDDCPGYLLAPGFDRAGRYPLSLSVEWTGSYRIDDGAFIQFADSVTRTSPSLTINVRQARTELISGEDR